MNYDQAFGGAGAASAKRLAAFVRSTRSFQVPSWATKATVVVQGSGGGGAFSNNTSGSAATGGNSGPWGQITLDVQSGQTLAVNLGAGGAAKSTQGNGNAGSSSTVVLAGTTVMTVPGGEGGVYGTTTDVLAATPAAAVTGGDFWVPGLPAYNANQSANAGSGGAAANIFNMTVAELTPGGANQGRHVGMPGNLPDSTPLMGVMHPNIPVLFFSTTIGHPGVGGSASGSAAAGLFAGGGGSTGSGTFLRGGIGGGGGGGNRSTVSSFDNSGGAAIAYVVFSE